MSRESIKLIHAALDEEDKEIILRGVIDPASLPHLKVGEYQREILPLAKINDLAEAFKNGSVPDIDLGMRGGAYLERDGAFYLQSEVFIVDGLQRRTGAVEAMKRGVIPRLGATVHFNTSEDWERKRFRILNMNRVKLSPNVLLRNMKKENEFVDMLFNMGLDKSFILANKVCWEQRMRRDQLITALTLLKATSRMHSRFSVGLRDTQHEGLANYMLKVMEKLGRMTVRENIRSFWQLIDDCWNIKNIHFKEGAVYLRQNFLMVFADILTHHQTFWKDSKLTVDRDLKKKIAMFPLNDPEVARLSSAGGTAQEILYQLFVNHINSGKRTRHLVPFKNRRQIDHQPEVAVAAAAVVVG